MTDAERRAKRVQDAAIAFELHFTKGGEPMSRIVRYCDKEDGTANVRWT